MRRMDAMLEVMSLQQPVPDNLMRALGYVHVANIGGSGPDYAELNAFVNDPPFSFARAILMSPEEAMRSLHPDRDDVSERLISLGWVIPGKDGRFALTRLGRAVLRGLRLEETGHAESEPVVIRPDDPLNYAMLTRAVAEAGAGMLCDPYFKPDMLRWLSASTSVQRVLVKRARQKKERLDQEQLFPVFLGAVTRDVALEVRITDDDSFHDRGLVAANGDVILIGTSLTGIGTHLTVVVPLPEVAGRPWREHHERLWEAAERIEPLATIRSEPTPEEIAADEQPRESEASRAQ